MLKPAILYKTQIEQKFAEIMYTDDAFYYNGYGHANTLPEIKTEEGYYQWAVVDESDDVVGYITYFIYQITDSVERFGLISFEKNSWTLAADMKNLLKCLAENHRRVEWRCVEGNPANKSYTAFCNRFHGYKQTLHKCLMDNNGRLRDCYIYEIINDKIKYGENYPETE